MLNNLWPMLLILVSILVVSSCILLRSNLSVMWKAVLTPAAYIAGVVASIYFSTLLGYSVRAQLNDGAIVLAHNSVYYKNKKEKIEIWLKESAEQTRLISVPYSRKLEKALQEAEKGRGRGLTSKLRKKQGGPAGGDEVYTIDLEEPTHDMPRKDPEDEGNDPPPKNLKPESNYDGKSV